MSAEWNNGNNQDNDNGYNYGDNNEQDYAFQTVMRNGKPKKMSFSVASLVLGILSVVCCCLGWAGAVLGAGAVVLSILSKRRLGYFDGMSVGGLVLGIFGFVFGVALLVITYSMPPEFWEEYQKMLEEYSKDLGGDI